MAKSFGRLGGPELRRGRRCVRRPSSTASGRAARTHRTPDDVAHAAVFLAAEAASWITGITVDVAGGRIML